jgi:predicted site-specific integrase-resolvase
MARLPRGQRRFAAREVDAKTGAAGPVAADATQELVADMLASVTCFAARLYANRSQRFRRKVQGAAKEAEGLAG